VNAMLASRLARRSIASIVSEAGRRVYLQSRGFVCKQMHVPGKPKLIPTTMGFPPSAAWRTQAIRRRSDKKSKSAGATRQQHGIDGLS